MDNLLIRLGLEDETHRKVFKLVLFIALFFLGVSVLFGASSFKDWIASTAQGLGTEMLGALGTFLLVERIMDKQHELRTREEEEQRMKRMKRDTLVHDLKGESITIAGQAIEELRMKRWITDGTLQDMNLHGAKLSGFQLIRANLQNVRLYEGQLKDTNLYQADLSNADLSKASLEDADLQEADLSGATLRKSRMRNANLKGTYFSTATILPDGRKWTHETNMEVFTNPDHPQYFDPCMVDSDLWYCNGSDRKR